MTARLALVLALVLARPAPAAEPVVVTNLPDVQKIRGHVTVEDEVRVTGHLQSTRFLAFQDRLVPPQGASPLPRDTVALGDIDATGSSSVILSLAAWIPQGGKDSGALGIVLVPDVAVVKEALDRDGSTPFALRLVLPLAGSSGRTVSASSEPLVLAFPRWNAFLYNTGEGPLRAHAFLMLGN